MERNDTLISASVAVLGQARDLLGRLRAGVYSSTAGLPVASGAGPHLRHCLDFYDALLDGLETGRVDYNLRERDEATERDPHRAIARIDATIARLEATSAPASTPLLVRAEGPADPLDPSSWVRSSLARELVFLSSHTVHHFALVALLVRLQGVEPGAEFGVAPSTLEAWRSASHLHRDLVAST
jgi:hypothetical protein